MSVVLNPTSPPQEKESLRWQLQSWSALDVCPLEDPDLKMGSGRDRRGAGGGGHHQHRQQRDEAQPTLGPHPQQEQGRHRHHHHHHRSGRHHHHHHHHHHHQHYGRGSRPRTVLHKALDALQMDWRCPHLRLVLTHDFPPAAAAEALAREGRLDQAGHFLWNGEK